MEVIIIIGLIVLGAASSWNIFLAGRKLKAGIGYGVGYAPELTEKAKSFVGKQKAQAKLDLQREGDLDNRVFQTFVKKGTQDAKRTWQPSIESDKQEQAALEEDLRILQNK